MINLYRTKKDFDDFIKQLKTCEIGLVPTMGNLHQGHLSLLEQSLKENQVSIITIFVNPKQFGPNEDFEKYPRTLDNDLALISSKSREFPSAKVAVYAPINPQEIYPNDFSTTIHVDGHLTKILCAQSRPTHFSGVTTVVYKLFQISKATNAYFGQKDFQQYKVIEKMVSDLEMNIHLHMVPIVREENGLALSSRNQYLNENDKKDALKLRNNILEVQKLLEANNIQTAKNFCLKLESEDFEYLKILDASNLKEINDKTQTYVILGALKIGPTRLIDNQLVAKNAR